MAVSGVDTVILAIIIGTLAAIVYSLRIMVLMERRIAKIDINLERIVFLINEVFFHILINVSNAWAT